MDIGASNWSEIDTNNNQPAPDGAPEGMFPSGVNDTIRAVMGALKRWFNWSVPKITTGSATAYTLAYGVSPGALVDGMTHLVRFHAANGAGATLNVNSLGAKPLYAYSRGAWYQAPPGLFDVDTVCRVAYDAGTGVYRLLMPGTIATGMIVPDAGSTAPAGHPQCFVRRSQRPTIRVLAVIGTTHGACDADHPPTCRIRHPPWQAKTTWAASNASRPAAPPAGNARCCRWRPDKSAGVTSVVGAASGMLDGHGRGRRRKRGRGGDIGGGVKALGHTDFVDVSGSPAVWPAVAGRRVRSASRSRRSSLTD